MIADRFAALSEWLKRHAPLWTFRPFRQLPAPWEEDHPEVSRWLRGLSDDEVLAYDDAPSRLAEGPPAMRQWVRSGETLAAIEPAGQADPQLSLRWGLGVPGRKRDQIRAFIGAVEATLVAEQERFVDWCAGKGHLGRALGTRHGATVTFVERRADLVERALLRAGREGVVADGAVTDVLEAPPRVGEGTLIALHACGALTDAAILRGPARLAVVPCCYHYQAGRETVTRSRAAAADPLELVPQQLRFATAEEVGAPMRRRRRRQREEAFRLGLDLLQREATGEDRYHHVPPIPRRWLSEPFAAWAERVAEHHAVTLPRCWDPVAIEAQGWRRARLARAMGLARVPFRRPLEIWYLLDRARWLEELGYRVRLRQICERRITPRNVLLAAER